MKPHTFVYLAIFTSLLALAVNPAYGADATATDTITIVPASNCPTTPPPEAIAAGFTTLMKCWDGASPYYGNIANWLSCPEITATAPEWFGSMTNSTNTLTCAQVISQTKDPLTGQTVLDLHWPDGAPGYLKMTTNGGSRGDVEYAQGGLVEIRSRLTPRLSPPTPTYPGPAFFSWHDYPAPGTIVGAPAPLEDDYIEWYSGEHSDVALHDWGQWRQTSAVANGVAGSNAITLTNVSGMPITTGAQGLPETPQCVLGPPYPSTAFNASTSYFIWTYDPTTGAATLSSQEGVLVAAPLAAAMVNVPIWLNSCADGWYPGDQGPVDITAVHTFGLLTTTDGSTFIQKCGYVDHVLLGNPQNKAGIINCGQYNFARETFHYTETKSFRWWIGGTEGTTDQYVYDIAIWGRPTCVPLGSDPTCAGPANTPSPIVIQR